MHISVLLKETIDELNLRENSIVVDCTLGYGGHSSEILKRIPKGKLYSFDQDDEAIISSTKRLSEISNNFAIIKSNFVHLKEKLEEKGISKVDAVVYDLGVSSPQLDEDERGFSFHKDSRLDMRMDRSQKLSAHDVVNNYSYNDLTRIFREYGEEKYASSIAKKIVDTRNLHTIDTTLELVDIIKDSVPFKYKNEKHPARKVFQAIRIEVNNELEVFENSLKQALDIINVGGRICVITFHSLEDRICKNIFKEYTSVPKELSKLPIIPEELKPKYKLIGSFEPSEEEIINNKRSRSARLRVIERIKD